MVACIDIGGGTTRVGFSNDGKTFAKIIKFPTENIFADEINHIVQEINAVTSSIEAIIISAAGSMDREKGIIISWGQKKSWWGQKVFEPLSEHFPQAKLLIENDANLAALGEAVVGSGKNYSLVGYVTLSTGVGGCLIVKKQIIPHSFGIEPGHQIVNFLETKTYSCGQKGCFESYASGTAFKQIFGMNPEECTDENIWKKYGEMLAVGFANLITFWSPEVIVIGGGVSGKFESFIKPLEEKVVDLLPMYHIPKIVKAELEEAGLSGCLAYYIFQSK
jgi:glucokinase